jgi:hypothetical protein
MFGSASHQVAAMLQALTPVLQPVAPTLPGAAAVQLTLPLQPCAVPLPPISPTLPAVSLSLPTVPVQRHVAMMSPGMAMHVVCPVPRWDRRGERIRGVGLRQQRGDGREDDACKNQQQSDRGHVVFPRQGRMACLT